ncbi:MAG: phospholipase D-like domain-containing protein [Pseudomonadales bacterium]
MTTTVDFDDLQALLLKTLEDFKLDQQEKHTLRELVKELPDEQTRYLRNTAFDLVRPAVSGGGEEAIHALQWLERVVKLTTAGAGTAVIRPSVHFSPGDDCRRKIVDLLHNAKQSIAICVFTISDDRISEQILNAHKRTLDVRIITDNDKANDKGSDVDRLRQQGVAVRKDRSSNHMHHKFAVIDRRFLINGSFNWTRSASDRNEENILVMAQPQAVQEFQAKFEELWNTYSD